MKQYFYLDSANFSTICNSGLTTVHGTVNFFVGRCVFVCAVETGMAPVQCNQGHNFFPCSLQGLYAALPCFLPLHQGSSFITIFFLVLYLCTWLLKEKANIFVCVCVCACVHLFVCFIKRYHSTSKNCRIWSMITVPSLKMFRSQSPPRKIPKYDSSHTNSYQQNYHNPNIWQLICKLAWNKINK